ncbi:MAG: phytanoyl-CoA dioxygenase family protein [Bacteroidota bacterium]
MASLPEIFKKYTGILRSFRGTYFINNLLNAQKLKRNKALYEKHGLKKSIFGSISSSDFKQSVGETPWLDRPDALVKLEAHPEFAQFDDSVKNQLRQWVDKGYIILKGFFTTEEAEALNTEVDQILNHGKTDFNYGNRVMDAHRVSGLIDQQHFRNKKMLYLLNFIMGEPIHPFQTINFIEGSEQKAHSDFIHMTSEPKGYLIATWTALENTDAGNGPLFYYPGSHKLPYIMSGDFDTGHGRWFLGNNTYKHYEDKIEELIKQHQLEKQYFHAEKGDVLIWHANLLHGGSPIKEQGRTRKSMVAHYFCENVISYHEISQRPAILDN